MIEGIEKGEIAAVLVKDLSRVGRDYLQVGFYTEVMFREKGVRFVAITNGVDTELHNIRKCVDIALRADQPEQTRTRTKRHEQER